MIRKHLLLPLLVAAVASLGLVPAAQAEEIRRSAVDSALLERIADSNPNNVPLIVDARGWAWFSANSKAQIRQIGERQLWRVQTRDYTAKRAVAALPDYAVFANVRHQRPEPVAVAESVGPQAVSGTDYRGITGADVVNAAGNKGAGQSVAVIDTGILADNPYFDDANSQTRVVAQGCWVYRDGSEDFPCLNGANSDTSAGSAEVSSLTAARQYDYSHGSHVAGIAAGRAYTGAPVGVTDGMAPEADIIALRVFGSGGAWDSDILSALDWVLANANTYDIASVNLSLGSYPSSSCDAYFMYGELFGDLLVAGVAPVVAAGNDSVKNAIGSPACAPNAMSIAATTPDDQIAWFSNLGTAIDLGAPGTSILSLAPGSLALYGSEGNFEAWNGTSMATPVAAGAFALAKAAGFQLSPSTWLTHMRNTATNIAAYNVNTKRINIDLAIEAASNALPPSPPANVQVTQADWNSFTVTWQAPSTGSTPTGYRVSRNGSILANVSASTFSFSGTVLNADTVISVQSLTSGSISSSVNRTVTETSLTDPNWQLRAAGSPFVVTDLVGADLCTLGGNPRVELSYYSPTATNRQLVILDGTGRSLVVTESVDPTPATGFSGTGYARRIELDASNTYLRSTSNVFVFDNLSRLSDGVSLAAAAQTVTAAVSAGNVSPDSPTGLVAEANRLRADLSWNQTVGHTWRIIVDDAAVTDTATADMTLPLAAGSHEVQLCAVLTREGREYTSAPTVAVSVDVLPLLAQSVELTLAGTLTLGGSSRQASVTSSASLPVEITSLTPSVCSVDGSGLVRPLALGTCSLSASSAGNADYAAASDTLSVAVGRPVALPVRTVTVTFSAGKARFGWLAPSNFSLSKVTNYRVKYRVALPGKAFGTWRTVSTTNRYWLSARYARGTRIEVLVTAVAEGGNSTSVRKLVRLP